MQNEAVLDISENDISKLNRDFLDVLLFDRTSRKHIIWGTDDYAEMDPNIPQGMRFPKD